MTEPPVDPPPDDRQPGAAPPVQSDAADGDVDAPERSDSLAPWYTDGLGWGVVGAGTVATAVGVALYVNGTKLDDDAETEDRESVRQDLLDRSATRRTWGTVATIAGVAGIAVGVVRLALTPEPTFEERSVSLEVGPSYVGVVGRF